MFVVETMSFDGIYINCFEARHTARKFARKVKNNNYSVSDVEIYKYNDYVKLHPDFPDKLNYPWKLFESVI